MLSDVLYLFLIWNNTFLNSNWLFFFTFFFFFFSKDKTSGKNIYTREVLYHHWLDVLITNPIVMLGFGS